MNVFSASILSDTVGSCALSSPTFAGACFSGRPFYCDSAILKNSLVESFWDSATPNPLLEIHSVST